MTTIINTPRGSGDGESSAVGLVLGIIVTLIVGGLIVYYVFPSLRGAPQEPSTSTTEINVEVPTPSIPTPTPAPAE